MSETLCKLYLELAEVVPDGTKTRRDLAAEAAMKRALLALAEVDPDPGVLRAAFYLRNYLGLPRLHGGPVDAGVRKPD